VFHGSIRISLWRHFRVSHGTRSPNAIQINTMQLYNSAIQRATRELSRRQPECDLNSTAVHNKTILYRQRTHCNGFIHTHDLNASDCLPDFCGLLISCMVVTCFYLVATAYFIHATYFLPRINRQSDRPNGEKAHKQM
jgi:hypothetical protein